jgi:hypothetical protein
MMEAVDLRESRQTEVLVVAWVMTGAAIFTVGVKLFARVKIVQVVGWDDFFIFLSLVRHFLHLLISSMSVLSSYLPDFEHLRVVFRSLWGSTRLWLPHGSRRC